ncbi:RES family NAD+ phosphorylase [Brassicibacter mesophilus]|uniref:RES family NAD+ phosphorylase n=1 Tax=Brassicibacter mesophilus TaxID=745119 RepID=UPI003D240BF7
MEYDDFLPKLSVIEEKYLEEVQEQVKYCVTCQPYDGGDYIWILGEETTLEDIFEEFEVPEIFRDRIAPYIFCNNCGARNFERYDIVGKEDRFDRETKKKIEQAEKTYGKLINSFEKHLELYPTLGHAHSLGKKIYREITSGNIRTAKLNGLWYRGRIVSESKVYDCTDLNPPPFNKASDGRYNHAGQSVLYIGNSKDTVVSEVLEDDTKPSLIWLQNYEISKVDNILDLRSDWNSLVSSESIVVLAILTSRLMEKKVTDRKNRWKPEYFITRYVADCARLAEYKGIMYNSTRSYGENVALFDWSDSMIIPSGDPRVYIHKPKEDTFNTIRSFEDLF